MYKKPFCPFKKALFFFFALPLDSNDVSLLRKPFVNYPLYPPSNSSIVNLTSEFTVMNLKIQ